MTSDTIHTKLPIAQQHVTYTEAVKRGDYDFNYGGLLGKYDNVRTFWEDQLTRDVLRPSLAELMARKKHANQKLRIVDLGAGTGQGYELLTKIDQEDLDLNLYHRRVIGAQDIQCYLGLDLSDAMVARGNELYEKNAAVRFAQGDLRAGLGFARELAPFDIYFSAYGALSHLETLDLKKLLIDIARHACDGSLIVLDLLGRYSLEWPSYWGATTDGEKYADYSMSYLQIETNPAQAVEHFPMRYWTGAEIDALVKEVATATGSGLELVEKYDRSILVGRHIDTGEYNPALQPMRSLVNRLHQDFRRTDIERLYFDAQASTNHPNPDAAAFFDELISSWNILVRFFAERLHHQLSLTAINEWADYPLPLQFALKAVDKALDNTQWAGNGDPRANVIEPQLGYALRSLEHNLQRGLGCGHGLLVILKVVKA